MELPSSDPGHALRIEEFDTSKVLAHARRQADERKFDDFTIVDVDSHHDEASNFGDLLKLMDDEPMRQFARTNAGGRGRSPIPHNLDYEDAAGRLPRFATAKLERTPDNVLPDVAIANRRMDAMGVDYSCLLPTGVLRLAIQPRQDVEVNIAQAYNRWLVEVLLPQAPRLRGMLYMPLCDAKACYDTILKYGDKPGIVGALIVSSRTATLHRNAYMNILRALEERSLLLTFHSGVNWYDRTLGLSNRYLAVKTVSGPYFNSVHMTNWIVNGLSERFPKLKLLWMESGIAWIPALMARLDAEYMMRSYDAPMLKRRPSDYMRDMYYCSQPLERPDDMILLEAMFRAIKAESQLVWGSNFPSSDFDLPSTIYDLPFLNEQAKRNILGGNAAKLLRLE